MKQVNKISRCSERASIKTERSGIYVQNKNQKKGKY